MRKIIKGNTGDWEIVIGLEVHAQVISNSKLFSGAPTTFGAEPNSNVSLVDAAMPGMLPVVNMECVRQAVKTGLGLNAIINKKSVFARKNYFYADLPQGYQITQPAGQALVGEGVVEVNMGDYIKKVRIEQLHIEQDAGKSIHDMHPRKTFIDLNRSGVCLMEIVSKPDIHSAEEAGAYFRKLRSIVRYLETCDGNMDQGSMRADVNVSVNRVGEGLGTRREIKNMNSIKHIENAIAYESMYQVKTLEAGGTIDQCTLLWDINKGETRVMRSKEDAHDYRYFPDPDLLPLVITDEFIEDVRKTLPELPDAKRERFVKEYGITDYDADILTQEKYRADFYEEAAAGKDGKLVSNWLVSELLGILNKNLIELENSPISAKQLGELVGLIEDNTISGKIAKQVFEVMFETSKDPSVIVEEKGLKQVTDTGAIEAIVDEVIAENQAQVADYQGGNDRIFGFFVGQVMKKSQGKANPGIANKLLKEKLG
ncbi:MAG: Asp-tRNA(Asn)/Glu-tRNA(Gln) amidotransferase subunit GatB [Alphaproteobacteria bacterium]|jgi:aspartyl-tRNA(Asn)/glutamyl-tRNA(Gln) amidotransferase subunit B|nr:Asp-tRNA(Asn)/Glu-tRNA(Gln) amidotransferase subunit GatB [Alphaproteobacteria bacterium]